MLSHHRLSRAHRDASDHRGRGADKIKHVSGHLLFIVFKEDPIVDLDSQTVPAIPCKYPAPVEINDKIIRKYKAGLSCESQCYCHQPRIFSIDEGRTILLVCLLIAAFGEVRMYLLEMCAALHRHVSGGYTHHR